MTHISESESGLWFIITFTSIVPKDWTICAENPLSCTRLFDHLPNFRSWHVFLVISEYALPVSSSAIMVEFLIRTGVSISFPWIPLTIIAFALAFVDAFSSLACDNLSLCARKNRNYSTLDPCPCLDNCRLCGQRYHSWSTLFSLTCHQQHVVIYCSNCQSWPFCSCFSLLYPLIVVYGTSTSVLIPRSSLPRTTTVYIHDYVLHHLFILY